jgi:hypothetical protein
MNFFRKVSLYLDFRKKIRKNRAVLLKDFGIRIDLANRLYTVINVPDVLGEPYNVRKVDIDKTAEVFIKEYALKLRLFLDSIGLSEMYDFYQPIRKLDKFSYLLVLGYKFMDSVRINNIFWFGIIPILFGSVLYTIYSLFF